MREYFKEKVAVVTGAASGIGSGLTKHLLANGEKALFMGTLILFSNVCILLYLLVILIIIDRLKINQEVIEIS